MGGVNGEAELTTISERGAITSLDGQDGLGHWQVWNAAELGVVKAKEFGISLVSVKNSSHCGALGVYLYPALDAGQIAMILLMVQQLCLRSVETRLCFQLVRLHQESLLNHR